MKEKILHYIWQHKLLRLSELKLTSGESIQIFNAGFLNENSGPDFSNAKVAIEDIIWFGHIEIHVKSSDWYQHHHENNKNYDAVILHVVYEHDVEVFTRGNKVLPTLELKDYIPSSFIEKYNTTFNGISHWIPCEKQISIVDDFTFKNWLERLYLERLEQKSEFILKLLEGVNYDFEVVLFQLLAKNFGLKVNGDAFLKLATSLDFSIVRKIGRDEFKMYALLFGQAGFLDEEISACQYQEDLKKEYQYLKHKFKLKPLAPNAFQFFRMRPSNFPTIRLAQLASLYVTHKSLFAKIITSESPEDFYALFKIHIASFWETHYTFNKSSNTSKKRLTKSFIDLLIINTIVPLKFVYQKYKGISNEDGIMSLMQALQPEKNSIISEFESLKISSENAFETQALLQLKTNYCEYKKCLSCNIGNYLLKN
ncbi:DUF2851 family protein [uncultured Tenacibaculum sp.]|uniref:DUF2851 family protein n=1 Tax=uncultured Tenacibaculum sp. TaxID=174713 RepID=UPI00262E04AB|nr:DUF2851 family protein [uncultured Tenacibaculum sp.]